LWRAYPQKKKELCAFSLGTKACQRFITVIIAKNSASNNEDFFFVLIIYETMEWKGVKELSRLLR